MKIFRYMLMAVLILGMSGAFRASAAGFSWNLQDPVPGPFFDVTPGVPFSFTFLTCDQTVGGIEYFGCANGRNTSTTDTLTTIQFSFANTPVLQGFTGANCISNAFSDISCALTNNGTQYELIFNDACGSSTCGIAPGGIFNIYENAVDGSEFPEVDGIANAPEPSSLWLALSGMGSLGYLVRRRRTASRR